MGLYKLKMKIMLWGFNPLKCKRRRQQGRKEKDQKVEDGTLFKLEFVSIKEEFAAQFDSSCCAMNNCWAMMNGFIDDMLR